MAGSATVRAVARALPPHFVDQETLIAAFREHWEKKHFNVERLEDLADIAGQSRSTFAARFRKRVGETPVGYATGWRLTIAASRLRAGRESASSIAGSLGFLSDSAFGAAFKRKFGISPGQYRAAAGPHAMSEAVLPADPETAPA